MDVRESLGLSREAEVPALGLALEGGVSTRRRWAFYGALLLHLAALLALVQPGGGGRLRPDEMAIPHQVSSRVAILDWRDPPPPSPRWALAIPPGISNEFYTIDFTATRGQPGGLDPGGEVVAVTVGYLGIGQIYVAGDNGTKLLTAEGFASWENITVTSNSPSEPVTFSGSEIRI